MSRSVVREAHAQADDQADRARELIQDRDGERKKSCGF
jgi:hypothetical protein